MKCDRCQAQTPSTIMSMFNTQEICEACLVKEKGHPKYGEAVEAERKAVIAGAYNFPGIGLPKELR